MRKAKYLVCVDEREESHIALRFACMLAAARGSAVDILHVIAPIDFHGFESVAERMREESRDAAHALLHTLADASNATYGICPNMLIREGVVGEEIIAAAMEDHEVSVVMIGVGGQSAASGGASLAVWLTAQLGGKLFIPLLMVPGNLTHEQLISLI